MSETKTPTIDSPSEHIHNPAWRKTVAGLALVAGSVVGFNMVKEGIDVVQDIKNSEHPTELVKTNTFSDPKPQEQRSSDEPTFEEELDYRRDILGLTTISIVFGALGKISAHFLEPPKPPRKKRRT